MMATHTDKEDQEPDVADPRVDETVETNLSDVEVIPEDEDLASSKVQPEYHDE